MDAIPGQPPCKRPKRIYKTYYGWDGRQHPVPRKDEEVLEDMTYESLAYYNSKHDLRYELVEYLHVNCVSTMMDPIPGFYHLSFIAKTVNPPRRLRLFFAEVHCMQGTDTYHHNVQCCTPVDPDTPLFRLGCGSCHPLGVIYHPLRAYNVGGSHDEFCGRSLCPKEESAKKLLSEKYTFKSSQQNFPPDEDKEFRKLIDSYARGALTQNCAFKLFKVVQAIRFSDFQPHSLEDAVFWVHMWFLAKDIFCNDSLELFFAEYCVDRPDLNTCVRLSEVGSVGLQGEYSCTLCRKYCPMFHRKGQYCLMNHPKGKYCAGIKGGSFVDALDEERSWGKRVYLEEKQPLVATQPGL